MKQYIELGLRILNEGEKRDDRTGKGTLAVFNHNMTFDLREAFPLVTIKKTNYAWAFLEMLWFLRGEDNTKWLHEHGCNLWDDWAGKNGHGPGELGPIYGVQWRSWSVNRTYVNDTGKPVCGSRHTIDQVRTLIDGLRNNPTSRRHIVTAWNVGEISEMGLPPCHWAHQCYVSNSGHLDMTLFLRSSDFALGLPFNIAQYALLQHLYARASGLQVRKLHVHIGDAHLYQHHVDAMIRVLCEKQPFTPTAKLVINTDNTDIDGYKPDDFTVENYNSHPFVKFEVAV